MTGAVTIKDVTREIELIAERESGEGDRELRIDADGRLGRVEFGIAGASCSRPATR